MSLTLTMGQRRVLGVLIEKSRTTPEQYPLTINAVVAGCNQKSNRHPVYELTEGEVGRAVQELMHKGLVRRADSQPGARAVRYEHAMQSACGWSPREQAILAELMLRGPQTVGELRTRADRMSRMTDLSFVEGILNELGGRESPLVRVLPRAPGQSVVRYAHLLYPEDEEPAELNSGGTGAVSAGSPAGPRVSEGGISDMGESAGAARAADTTAIEGRLEALERRMQELESRIEGLLG